MSKVVFNYHTGELVSGKIEPPPAEWFVENVLLPMINIIEGRADINVMPKEVN